MVLSEKYKDKYTTYITDTPRDAIIIGRYSVMPYYALVEKELRQTKASRLVNSVEGHEYITSMQWTRDLDTFPTYLDSGWASVPDCEQGWVCKGLVSSRKFKWNTHMRAKTREDLKLVMGRLLDDSLISQQGVAIREYVPLEQLDEPGINGLPITNEWRVFFLYGRLVEAGFYWPYSEALPTAEDEAEAVMFATEQAEKISGKVDFFVLDVAKTEDGKWIVVEVNDGQMSGLSTINPNLFYSSLMNIVSEKENE